MRTAKLSQHQSATHNTGPGVITAGDGAAPAGRPPTRAERLDRWREQPAASIRPPEPRPRPCGGYMLGSGN
jgi:hypothetical protein